jgi:hypothetical protein
VRFILDFFGKIIMNDLSTLVLKIDTLSLLLTKILMEIHIGFSNKIKSNYDGHDGHYYRYDHHEIGYWNDVTRHLSQETISLIRKEVKKSIDKEIAELKKEMMSALNPGFEKSC